MSMSKVDAINDLKGNRLSHQQALVDKIQGNPGIKLMKRIIPGGKNLMEMTSREDLPKACYTWLRHCSYFTEFMVSFVSDANEPDKYEKRKVQDFDARANNLEWDTRGKNWLSQIVAENLLKDKVIAVSGSKDGLFIHVTNNEVNSESDNWEPFVQFVPFKPNRR